MHTKPLHFAFLATLVFTACAPNCLPPAEGLHQSAVTHLREAREQTLSDEQRAVLYLDSAREASAILDSHESGESARMIYNKAAADLTVLLRSAQNGGMWNRPLTLSQGGTSYKVRFAKGTRDGVWNPDHFTSFTQADTVDLKTNPHFPASGPT